MQLCKVIPAYFSHIHIISNGCAVSCTVKLCFLCRHIGVNSWPEYRVPFQKLSLTVFRKKFVIIPETNLSYLSSHLLSHL